MGLDALRAGNRANVVTYTPLVLVVGLGFGCSLLVVFVRVNGVIFAIVGRAVRETFPVGRPLRLFFNPVVFVLLRVDLTRRDFDDAFYHSTWVYHVPYLQRVLRYGHGIFFCLVPGFLF